MDKIQALTEVHTLLEKQVEALVQQGQRDEPDAANEELERLQDLRAEVLTHAETLGHAVYFCEIGQTGTLPADWEPFDAHATVAAALGQLPGGGQLSSALRAFLNEIPGQQQQAHDEVMSWLLDSVRQNPDEEGQTLHHSALLDAWNREAVRLTSLLAEAVARQKIEGTPGPSPLKTLTDQQVRRYSMNVLTQGIEQTAFAMTYAADVARAQELARQRGDWAAILDCLL